MKFHLMCCAILFAAAFTATAAYAQTTASPCNQLNSGSSPPTGYGASWNTQTSAKELLVYTTCDSDGATYTVGSGAQNQYVYKVRYIYSAANSSWVSTTLGGSFVQSSNDWLQGQGTLIASGRIISDPLYWVGYVCQWTGSQWKCGCRDATCAMNYWQLQASSDPFSSSGTGGGTTGGGNGGNGGTIPTAVRTINVSSSNELNNAINNAQAGDHIVLANGSYGGFSVSKNGQSGRPIVIRAANKLGARVTGAVTLTGNDVWLVGIHMTAGGVDIKGNRDRISSSRFEVNGRAIEIFADNAIVDHNDLDSQALCDSKTWFLVLLNSPTHDNYNPHIYRNYFHDAPELCGDGDDNSAIHIGGNAPSTRVRVGALVEYNLFRNMAGDGEIISNKSSNNTYQFNTAEGGNKEFINRHGEDNKWIANWLEDSISGILVRGPRNTFIGNRTKKIRVWAGNCTPDEYGVKEPDCTPGGFPSAWNTTLIGNTATLQIGVYSNGLDVPARDTLIEANNGPVNIDTAHAVNTTQHATTNSTSPQAFKINCSNVNTDCEVGPFAPTAPQL